jgi:hypothetical protein
MLSCLLTSHSLRWWFLGLFSLLASLAQAQHDVILRTNGAEINAKVLTIRPDRISYLHLDTAATDTLAIASQQVFMIRYANGTKEVISRTAPAPVGLTRAEASRRGANDARMYFKAPGAFWGTYGATVINPMAGLATGAVFSAIRPGVRNLTIPQPAMLQNPDYVRGYQQQAQRKKLGKAAAGFGAGMGTLVLVVLVVLSSIH